jgi:hypothetical protein
MSAMWRGAGGHYIASQYVKGGADLASFLQFAQKASVTELTKRTGDDTWEVTSVRFANLWRGFSYDVKRTWQIEKTAFLTREKVSKVDADGGGVVLDPEPDPPAEIEPEPTVIVEIEAPIARNPRAEAPAPEPVVIVEEPPRNPDRGVDIIVETPPVHVPPPVVILDVQPIDTRFISAVDPEERKPDPLLPIKEKVDPTLKNPSASDKYSAWMQDLPVPGFTGNVNSYSALEAQVKAQRAPASDFVIIGVVKAFGFLDVDGTHWAVQNIQNRLNFWFQPPGLGPELMDPLPPKVEAAPVTMADPFIEPILPVEPAEVITGYDPGEGVPVEVEVVPSVALRKTTTEIVYDGDNLGIGIPHVEAVPTVIEGADLPKPSTPVANLLKLGGAIWLLLA